MTASGAEDCSIRADSCSAAGASRPGSTDESCVQRPMWRAAPRFRTRLADGVVVSTVDEVERDG